MIFRKNFIFHIQGKNLSEGLEDVLYVCPVCHQLHHIRTEKNTITCQFCQTKGYVDEYGFIQGFPYDNLIEWNKFQRQFKDELRKSEIQSEAIMYFVNDENLSLEKNR